MATVDKANIKLGFWIAAGFFIFGLIMAVIQYTLMRARGGSQGG